MKLTRDQVLAGALALLDEVGIDNLTMRRLATSLGVQNGATYWHFRSKQALLASMAEAMLADVTTGLDRSLPWDEQLTQLAHRLHRALLAHRDGARIFSGVFFPLPNALAYGDTMIGLLRAAGLPIREAAWAVDTFTYYVVGHTIEEQLAADDPARAQLTEAVATDQYPNLAAAIEHIPAPHPPEHFEYGLRLLINGLRR
ncbi:MAG TPA: TetR/AcrR family transcriptional regulator C-terminal domain-containing protein [Pseudonocardiaceae bacterium]|nr:TetR/AcrR family transcriptional regulator C-terminal domain-containing protein [Pseudonocardiaceae bacterium]